MGEQEPTSAGGPNGSSTAEAGAGEQAGNGRIRSAPVAAVAASIIGTGAGAGVLAWQWNHLKQPGWPDGRLPVVLAGVVTALVVASLLLAGRGWRSRAGVAALTIASIAVALNVAGWGLAVQRIQVGRDIEARQSRCEQRIRDMSFDEAMRSPVMAPILLMPGTLKLALGIETFTFGTNNGRAPSVSSRRAQLAMDWRKVRADRAWARDTCVATDNLSRWSAGEGMPEEHILGAPVDVIVN